MLKMLFHTIFVVVKSEVLVVSSSGHLIKLRPAEILSRLGSSFSGRKSTTILAHVGTHPSACIFVICAWFMTDMQFIPGVSVLSSPCVILPTSFPKPFPTALLVPHYWGHSPVVYT